MITLFPASCMNDFTVAERVKAEQICDAINLFVDADGGDSQSYASLKEFAAGDYFEEYLEAYCQDPVKHPFFNLLYDEDFIKDINFIHAYCMSGGRLSSFINSYGFATIDGSDLIEQAIYHGPQSIALWFHDCAAELANIKAFELLVANVFGAVQNLAGNDSDEVQYASSRKELRWLGHESLLHCITGEMIEHYQGKLPYEQRRLLVTLEPSTKDAIQNAVRAVRGLVDHATDDEDVSNDHLQHLLAIAVYTPAYSLMLQGAGALEVAHLVKQKARAILDCYYFQSIEVELSQVVFNALSTFPQSLRQIFPLADQWVVAPKASRSSVPSFAGPVIGFAKPYSACMNASVKFFATHYGNKVNTQLLEHVTDNPQFLHAMLDEGRGYVQYLDETLTKHKFTIGFVLPVIEKIGGYTGAWTKYSSQAVCSLFTPLLDVEIKSSVGTAYAKYFTQAIASHPALKTFIIDQWIAKDHISLVDLKFTGLGSSDIPEMIDRLSHNDITGILETELGL